MHCEPDLHVLTYDHPHRKTQDLLYRLKLAGFAVSVCALRWQERRNHQPLFGLGLPPPLDIEPHRLCGILGFEYRRVGTIDEHFRWTTDKPILIAGAPILHENFVGGNRVFNVHPGWLPRVRGLDSLKWAIYCELPVGVAVHQVDREVDLGKLVVRRKIPLLPTDSFQSIALRQYETGLDLLVRAVVSGMIDEPADYSEPAGKPTRRMKHVDELAMMARLQCRLANLQVSSDSGYVDCPPPVA